MLKKRTQRFRALNISSEQCNETKTQFLTPRSKAKQDVAEAGRQDGKKKRTEKIGATLCTYRGSKAGTYL